MDPIHTGVAYLEDLGRYGFTVSIVCGPCGDQPFAWSVDVLTPTGQSFERPEAAHSFEHAVMIAEAEITRRQWWFRPWTVGL